MCFQRKYFCLIIVIVLLFTSHFCLAQPLLSLSGTIGGGVLLTQSSDLQGNIFNTNNYPLAKTGYTLSGKIRLSSPLAPLFVIGTVSYNSLKSDVIYAQYISSLSIIRCGTGIEYIILSNQTFAPYFGANIGLNFFSGGIYRENDSTPITNLKSTSRLGLDITLGTLIYISNLSFPFDFEVKYCLANVGGKEFLNSQFLLDEYNPSGKVTIPYKSYGISDLKDPENANDRDRLINFIVITLGINFNIL